jgi:hypothetical protein
VEGASSEGDFSSFFFSLPVASDWVFLVNPPTCTLEKYSSVLLLPLA